MSHNTDPARYDIAVIGGGAAGAMAAIRAAELGKRVLLIERNEAIGKKILITGKGRCNVTNIAPIETFIERFGVVGKFLRSAFYIFFNEVVIDFFRSNGLDMKIERQGRVFPINDKARSVVDVLLKCLTDNGVCIMYKARLISVVATGSAFTIQCEGGKILEANRIILATGGASYKATGSSGDGFVIARKLGHTIKALKPGLVPLTTEEAWVRDLQGLALEHIRVTFISGKKKIVSEIGELMFTHFGVSGPLVLDLSGDVMTLIESGAKVSIAIDLKPGLSEEQLDRRLLNDFKGTAHVKNVLKEYLPERLIDVFMALLGIGPGLETNQITQSERRAMINLFKGLPLTIRGSLPLEEAMVTGGGVATQEIDPRSMESRIVPGLYFAGEIIDGCASSGGYNLQQAFSTGYLAGQSAAK